MQYENFCIKANCVCARACFSIAFLKHFETELPITTLCIFNGNFLMNIPLHLKVHQTCGIA